MHRQKCDFYPGWEDNNGYAYNVTLPLSGESYVTQPCTRGQVGPLRNCGMNPTDTPLSCTPGAATTVTCTTSGTAAPQVARLCDFSHVLGAGTACPYQEAVANAVVEGSATFTFTCPVARDVMEIGGKVSLYTGAVGPSDSAAAVTCAVQ